MVRNPTEDRITVAAAFERRARAAVAAALCAFAIGSETQNSIQTPPA